MKTTHSSILTALVVLSLNTTVKAQYVVKEADLQFELFNYRKAIDLYEKAYQKKATLHTAERLAEAYHLTGNYKKAESWSEVASNLPGNKPAHTLNYAKTLQSNSKYDEAKKQYQKYLTLNPAISAAQQQIWLTSCDSAQYWINHPTAFSIVNEKSLNSRYADWGAVNYGDGVVFTSDRQLSGISRIASPKPFLKFDGPKLPNPNIYGWTGTKYLRLLEKKGTTDSLTSFSIDTKTNHHIAAASFTQDGHTLFFTLTRIPEKIIRKKGEPATINVEIYSSSKNASGNWGKPVPFRYNNVNKWSVGDPFISADGNTLYFVSDMAGGKGGTDIYSCIKNADGSWADAVNLTAVNTDGNERSPFIDANGDLYFSSDGLVGMGGLDIYKSRKTLAGFAKARNMGYPVNSSQDDFAFNIGTKGTGFLSSNRYGGLGNDDIYSVVAKIILAFKLEGTVYDSKTNLPVAGTLVTLSKQGGETVTAITDQSGTFKYDLDAGADFDLKGNKINYTSDAATLTTRNLASSTTLRKDLFLDPVVINKVIKIKNIYYDFDKFDIRPDAASELDKLVATLKTNQTIWIELGSHTDSRGNDNYNLWLSQKRADAAIAYIISKGIDKSRITGRGYGETKLANECANGVQCTEEMHQLNRRTEFKVTKE